MSPFIIFKVFGDRSLTTPLGNSNVIDTYATKEIIVLEKICDLKLKLT